MREFLVFVRAGSASLHPELLEGDPDRNWDCCVNVWSDNQSSCDGVTPEYVESGGLNKFVGFQEIYARTLADKPYQYVLMLDDDLRFTPGDVSRFFRLCRENGLKLAQPAIARGSHANHLVNIQNLACLVRHVNFVEVMAPCFSRDTLLRLMPTFSLTHCTWGIDYAWASIMKDEDGLAIVDAVVMQHTKPMDVSGGPFYRRLQSMGIDPLAELRSVHANFEPFGPTHTRTKGHVYRWPFPEAVNVALVQWIEKRKSVMHMARKGTLAPQTDPKSGSVAG
jgi:hypothetical protein